MLRGSVVIFTAILSTLFLGKRHPPYRWFALLCVFIGILIVGVSSIQTSQNQTFNLMVSSNKSFIGVLMVILAQIFTATQFVVEEKVLSRYDIEPLKAVGLEGLFGLISVVFLIPFAYFTIGIHGDKGIHDRS